MSFFNHLLGESVSLLPGAIARWNSRNVVLSGGNIQSFTDLIGSNHFTQADPGKQIALQANVQNGHPAALFTGSTVRYSLASSLTLGTAFTLFIVYDRTVSGLQVEYVLGRTGGGVYAYANTAGRSFGHTDGTNSTAATSASHSNAMSIHTHTQGALYRNAASMPLAINSGSTSLSGLNTLGGRPDQPTNLYYSGRFMELIIYPTVLNSTEMAQVWAFLNQEYALY